MNNIVEILAPVSNVNDSNVVVYEFLVENNSKIRAEQEVLVIETSKTTQTLTSPKEGFIRFVTNIGDEVPNGEILAIVAESADDIDAYVKETDIKKRDFQQKTVRIGENRCLFKKNDNQLSSETTILFGVYSHAITLGEIMIRNGDKVAKNAILCRVRNSSGIESVIAPADGYVFWNYGLYDVIPAGEAIGYISYSNTQIGMNSVINENEEKYDTVRLSKSARNYIDDNKISINELGLTGLITVKKIEERINHFTHDSSIIKQSESRAIEINNVNCTSKIYLSSVGEYEKISMAKKSEAKYLSEANKDAVVSQACVLVPTKGIISLCANDMTLAKKFSSIIIFEVSRLLKQYRDLISIYDDGRIFVYKEINIGYALAIDDGLKVPVFKHCDEMDIDSIIRQKESYIEKYVMRELSVNDISGGTFTITDLSSTGCYMFNPVLNLGQSAILGIGGENISNKDYPLILAYDHRVIDGATATEFLCKLRDRLIAHEQILLTQKTVGNDGYSEGAETTNIECELCFRSLEEVEEMGHHLLKTIGKFGEEKCICSLCLVGW